MRQATVEVLSREGKVVAKVLVPGPGGPKLQDKSVNQVGLYKRDKIGIDMGIYRVGPGGNTPDQVFIRGSKQDRWHEMGVGFDETFRFLSGLKLMALNITDGFNVTAAVVYEMKRGEKLRVRVLPQE